MMHKSVSTIDSPQFINLQPLEINPLMQSCEIKVLYVGQNRNHSYINKETAIEMSKTLRGAPIVGYFKKDKEDFGDHGRKVIIDDQGVKFQCQTKPYGFVAPDAKVWFKKFEQQDDFGNKVTREYLMTTGYLWVGQFEECKDVLNSGRPQSMELDENSLEGNWSTNSKTGMEFFIINDATFSKLCILGNDVEPCFEGASVTDIAVSSQFSLDDDFKHTLFSMMQDLEKVVRGGIHMNELENVVETTEEVVETPSVEETPAADENTDSDVTPDFKKEEEEKKQEEKPADEEPSDDKKETDKQDEDEQKEKAKKYELLENDYNELMNKFSILENEVNELRAYKSEIEDKKKDELINSFYMLSDDDKKDVINNKSQYSYDEIEAKLSVICVRKKVSFDLEEENNESVVTPTVTFNLDSNEVEVPAFIRALRDTKKNRDA